MRKVSTDSEDSVETHMTPTTTSMNPWKTHAPLSRDYLDKVRPFIDLIDTLRAHGLDQDVSLPAVAVIGDQSAGKSSTLEAISGIQLPRGSGKYEPFDILQMTTTVTANGYQEVSMQCFTIDLCTQ